MASVLSTIGYVLLAILVLGLCIIAHEFGHYYSARRLGLKVLEFAVGMGPAMVKWRRNGVDYSIRWIPIGGFCAFEGEEDGKDSPDSINNQPAWKRLVMTFSGPLMNFVLAIVLAVVLLAAIGVYSPVNSIGQVTPGSPAEQAGVQVGDVITSVNGQDSRDVATVQSAISATGGDPVTLTLERDGQSLTKVVEKRLNEEGTAYLMGVSFAVERVRQNVFGAIVGSVQFCYQILKEMIQMLGGLFFRGEGVGELAGPVGVIDMMTGIAQQGFAQSLLTGVDTLLRLALLISLNLGLMNLLPLPALDGGRIVLLAVEAVTGKHLPREKEAMVHFVGLMVLMGLILLITGRDVLRIFGVGA